MNVSTCINIVLKQWGNIFPAPGTWKASRNRSLTTLDPIEQLAVYITEKAAMEGKDTAAAWFAEHENITFEHLCRKGDGGYGPYSCITSFLRHTPEWNQKFHLLQAESNRLWDGFSDASELYLNLTQRIYGPWEEMNLAFEQWRSSVKSIGRLPGALTNAATPCSRSVVPETKTVIRR